jgi:hypothetical protein
MKPKGLEGKGGGFMALPGVRLDITISKTAQGDREYVQLMTNDMGVNVVLLADLIVLKDSRPKKEET